MIVGYRVSFLWTLRILSHNLDPDFSPGLSPQSSSIIQAVGGDNCYESNFYSSIALLSSIPTSIYKQNIFHQILRSGFWLMSLLCSVCYIFAT